MARGADGSMLTKEQLDQLNLDRYNQAVADGNLYNIGPIVDGGGTSFSPERWDDYFNKNPDVKPKDYTNQKDIQTKLDSGESIDTDAQEFVVDKNDVEIISEEDMTPSYAKRGKDNSFLTAEQANTEQEPTLADEVKADMEVQSEVEAETDNMDEFDTTVEGWTAEFEELSDEEFESAGIAIEQLPANAQEAYAALAKIRDDIEFDDGLSKAEQANQDKIDAITSQAPTEEEMDQNYTDTKDRALSEVDDMIIEQDYQDEVKSIDDFYEGNTEKKGMLTSNTQELGEGSGEAEADNLARDQAGDMEISDMKGKDREITTTIMQDTGLDMDQANALMGKLKGLCG